CARLYAWNPNSLDPW
nr:immunoglobulin heavy chain junction region [Macaca mulatta]MOW46498.1 immunoglobulin heavy chain junction region [Macaca mulatta]MOW48342.1 immunoglobulin heavy chain junction region [Macaca mulatta]MOW48800.1 immunoglobulin heavy chain junction region [Macaca mulatta]